MAGGLQSVARSPGNAAVASLLGAPGGFMAGGGGVPAVSRSPRKPGALRSGTPLNPGDAAVSQMLSRAVLARNGGPAGNGAPPKLGLPGGLSLMVPAGPGKVNSGHFDKTLIAGQVRIAIPVPIPPPLSAQIGGEIKGMARYAGNYDVNWNRPEADATDPLKVKDEVSVNGSVNATGKVSGTIFGKIGVDVKLASAHASASGTVDADAKGTLGVNGKVTREGTASNWNGNLAWNLNVLGTLTASAAGHFEWKVLWFHGKEEIFRLKGFRLGTLTCTMAGTMSPSGGVTVGTRNFNFTWGSPPPPQKVSERKIPAQNQPQVNPKRRSGAPPPPADSGGAPPADGPGGILARRVDDPPQQAPAAPDGAAPAGGAPGGDGNAQPEEQQLPDGHSWVAEAPIEGQDKDEGVEPEAGG